MHLRLLPEKGKYKIHGGVKMKGTVKRDFKVLTEKISPENIAVMAELIAMRETKVLIGFMGYHAEKAHKKLCKDIFCKDMPGYMLSDSYDLVQNVALFLCDHCGEYLDDFLYISEKGKQITIKMECYLIITRMLSKRYRLMQKYQSLEDVKEKGEISYMEETETEYQQDQGRFTRRRDNSRSESHGKHEPCIGLPHVRNELSRNRETAVKGGEHGI